jgi:hypothetical protein
LYWQEVIKAAEAELYELLCTKSKKYSTVRKHGKSAIKHWLPIFAAFLAGTFTGLTAAAATAIVAFVSLTIFRLGVGTFCRLYSETAPKNPESAR